MTSDTHDRIERLVRILETEAPHLDLQQIRPLLHDLAQESESGERQRVLHYYSLLERRLFNAKATRWVGPVDDTRREIELGQQVLFD